MFGIKPSAAVGTLPKSLLHGGVTTTTRHVLQFDKFDLIEGQDFRQKLSSACQLGWTGDAALDSNKRIQTLHPTLTEQS